MHRFEPVARYCSLLSVITSPYCTAMLPIKFSWKLLPNSMSIWLFPRAQAEENLLSQTCPLALLFGAFLTRSGSLGSACSAPEAPSCRHSRPQRHREPWRDVTGEEQVSSITSPCLGSAIHLLHLRVSMEETKPPPSSSHYPRGEANYKRSCRLKE